MLRLVLFLVGVMAAAVGLDWLAGQPGKLNIEWRGYEIETSMFRALILLAALIGLSILLASFIRSIWQSPANIGSFFTKRRNKRGLESLSNGMIAIGAGDRTLATRYAVRARKDLPNEPLTHLLRAQAAQLSGDRETSRRIFEAMLSSPGTEQLGLRGLYLEAEREKEPEAAEQFAERAVSLNPKLSWSIDALFDMQCRKGDWAGALETVTLAKKHGHIERHIADRRRAVLLTAQAQALEDSDPNKAMALALDAHNMAHDLVPAATIAGRMLASRGNTGRATKILSKTWKRFPHPDLASAYAYARLGDSPRDRLERVKQLSGQAPGSVEGPIAVATAAIDAKEWDLARRVLEPFLEERLSQRICTLMARIEGGQNGDTGRVREWLARAVHAPRDPAWTADGVVSEHWAPKSPVTGALDAFQWRVPVAQVDSQDSPALTAKRDELAALSARPEDYQSDPSAAPATLPPRAGTGTPAKPAGVSSAAVARKTDAVDADVVPANNGTARTGPSRPQPPRAASAEEALANLSPPKPAAQPAAVAGRVVQSAAQGRPVTQPFKPQQTAPVSTSPPAIRSGTAPAAASAQNGRPPAAVATPPAKVLTASAVSQRGKPSGTGTSTTVGKAPEPMIYTPPHAPDDPGMDGINDGIDDPRRTKDLPRDVPRGDPGRNQVRPGRGGR
jgi:HemY protein